MRNPKTTKSDTAPTSKVVKLTSASEPNHDRSSWIGLEPEVSVPVSFGSSPMTTSIAAPKRNPVTTARDRNCAIHPIFRTARSRNSTPDASVMVATKVAAFVVPVSFAATTALAATAANPELGPVEI